MSSFLRVLIIGDNKGVESLVNRTLDSFDCGTNLSKIHSIKDSLSADWVQSFPDFIILLIDTTQEKNLEGVDLLYNAFPDAFILGVFVKEEHEDPALSQAFLGLNNYELIDVNDLLSDIGQRLFWYILDKAREKSSSKALEANEERFKSIIEHAHDMVILLDESGTVVYNSPSVWRTLGYEPWEILGLNIKDFVHDEDRGTLGSVFQAPLNKKSEEEQNNAIELRFLHKMGSWRTLAIVHSNQLKNEMVQGIVLNARDISPRKAAEWELEQYRHHLEELVKKRSEEVEKVQEMSEIVLSSSPDALLAIDNKGIITFVSSRYRKLFPGSSERLHSGEPVSKLFEAIVLESRAIKDADKYEELKKWWSNPSGSCEMLLENGVWLRMQAQEMSEGHGTVIATTNITNYKEQQQILADSLQKEKLAAEQQRQFVSMVSHEFRTPLTIIDGNAQIIERRGDQIEISSLKDRANKIRSGVSRLVELMDRILSANKLEEGVLPLELSVCSLVDIVSIVTEDMQEVLVTHKFNLDIGDVPKEIVLDSKLVRLIVSNLVSNAIKFSPEGGDINIKLMPGEGETVIIEVQDFGLGIPEDEISQIFNRFFRASTSSGIPGSGIGLNLVKEFVEMQEGSLLVNSQVNEGTIVQVILPTVLKAE